MRKEKPPPVPITVSWREQAGWSRASRRLRQRTTLDARCKPDFARGFLFYELYIRAAGFESLSAN